MHLPLLKYVARESRSYFIAKKLYCTPINKINKIKLQFFLYLIKMQINLERCSINKYKIKYE